MARTPVAYLNEIIDSIEKIRRYTCNLSEESFGENELVVDAVMRHFGIIGEAAKHIPDIIQVKYPQIPWKHFMAMRNLVIPENCGFDLEIVWKTIRDSFPELLECLYEIRRQQS